MTTPLPINNRPGLGALQYRIGTYGDFDATMLARLADRDPSFAALNQLRTRSTDDPTIALPTYPVRRYRGLVWVQR